MSFLHATSLSVRGFRGIRETIELDFGTRLTIVYGGNATGKSSIAQAIEFALSGQILDHEDRPISTAFIANARESGAGTVTLRLSDGSDNSIPLSARTDESRNQIEQRFRAAGSVDWPERQHLPVTTTHITSQGALAKVLGAASVTRNDLSGLCAGSYLRFLVNRAQKLASAFRQAATGRNIQAELKDARGSYEAARVLYDTLAATRRGSLVATADPSVMIRELAASVGASDATSVTAVLGALDQRFEETEAKLHAIEALLLRMRDLGQYEVEQTQLRALVADFVLQEQELLAKKTQAVQVLKTHEEGARTASAKRASAIEALEAYERYQQSLATIASLSARVAEAETSIAGIEQEATRVKALLQTAKDEQRQRSGRVLSVRQSERRAETQAAAVAASLTLIRPLSSEQLMLAESRIAGAEAAVAGLRENVASAVALVTGLRDLEDTADQLLREHSQRNSMFLRAATELRTFVDGDMCPLCGHAHGNISDLQIAIEAAMQAKVSGSDSLRLRFEEASARRREAEQEQEKAMKSLAAAEASLQQEQARATHLRAQHAESLARVRDLLHGAEISVEASVQGLTALQESLREQLITIKAELAGAIQGEADANTTRHDLEREVAGRVAEREQLGRLVREIQDQIDAIRSTQLSVISSEDMKSSRDAIDSAELALAEAKKESGKITAEIREIERIFADKSAQRAGAERRLDAITGLLRSLDDELAKVGASRDVSALIELETSTRRRRDEFMVLRAKAMALQEQINEAQKHRSFLTAQTRFQEAKGQLEELQRRHQRVQRRSAQFSSVQSALEAIQSGTAESVLNNIRVPVGILFRAMTAGCQWDIEFKLQDDGRVEAELLDGIGTTLPASAILNSAYLNIAAVALRIALASQQNWTPLRTVVLDDPILEMDSLTQSALIDGLEAILASRHSPWNSLQFVITTWSEDFAVLAAHKLAHLNTASATPSDQFVIHRLGADQDGSATSERHVPRWTDRASAA